SLPTSSRSLCLPPARMHFCVLATRLYGGFSVPRKYGLNWFIPALAKSSVGSSCGTTGDDGTNWWPCFLQKKSMNCWRISVEEGMVRSVVWRAGSVSGRSSHQKGHGFREKVQ